MVCGDRGVAPDPRIFEAWTDARYDGVDDAEGRISGSGNAPLFVVGHRLRRIRSGYPWADSGRSPAPSPALPACVWPEKCPPPRFGGLNSWVSGW